MKFAIYLIRQHISMDENVDHVILLKKGLLNLCQNILSSSEDKNLIVKLILIFLKISMKFYGLRRICPLCVH